MHNAFADVVNHLEPTAPPNAAALVNQARVLSCTAIKSFVKAVHHYYYFGGKNMSEEAFDEFMNLFDQVALEIKDALAKANTDEVLLLFIKMNWMGVFGDMEHAADDLGDSSLKNVALRTQQLFLK